MSKQWLELGAVLALAAVTAASGIAVVRAKDDARHLFAELEELNRERDRLQVDWSRLTLELGTLSTHERIEMIALDRLELVEPSVRELYVESQR
jgi:cell division protein FtsL